ncbi:transmembrane protein 182 [Oncorhynchus tshawytscha]|uniref:Transmembrane protein 182 n=1 Tax=Oncorhynchus tshawytscha TaxID=74940 RepID=A0A8C8LQ92_ONCTS|nr:transmembrane protein 182 [Oncorhynchus tshawytscha]
MSPAERLSVLLFLAGFFGGLGALSLMLSFGTDYWLLALETCGPGGASETWEAGALRPGEGEMEDQDTVTFFHQGFFWRCSFRGRRQENMMWHFWITNQPHQKVCVPAYLFPFYASEQSTDYQAPDTAVYRAFWSIFLLVGVVTLIIGGFVIICASPLASHRLYKVGGALLLTGGLCLLVVIMMYVVWTQVLDTLEDYAAQQQHSSQCPTVYHLSVQYGLSFLFAPVSVFFSLLAALLFILIGRTVRRCHHKVPM